MFGAYKPPFPWFGGKSKVAPQVWKAFGDVDNYVEPFFGSGAVLFGRPTVGKAETVNDLDHWIANFWRAVKRDPEAVSYLWMITRLSICTWSSTSFQTPAQVFLSMLAPVAFFQRLPTITVCGYRHNFADMPVKWCVFRRYARIAADSICLRNTPVEWPIFAYCIFTIYVIQYI